MNAQYVLDELINWTVEHSGHQNRRGYVGLSTIGECERAIYEQQREARFVDVTFHLRTRLSYELEAALIERLRGAGLYGEPESISLYDGRVQGHTDGCIGEALLEIKTVAVDEHFPTQGRLPGRVYWQVQAYLHYAHRAEAIVIYLARASGKLRVYPIRYRVEMGRLIDAKVKRVLETVDGAHEPLCTCGQCGKE